MRYTLLASARYHFASQMLCSIMGGPLYWPPPGAPPAANPPMQPRTNPG